MPKASPEEVRGHHGKFARARETAERDAIACELKARGKTYRQIATELDVHPASAHEMVQRALRAIVEEPAAEVRRLELERLDIMYRAAMEVLERQHVTVSQGRIVKQANGEPLEDDAPVLQAIDRLLRVSESRRKLLGLDAPARVSVEAEHLGREIGDLITALTGGHDDEPADN
jgi:hypothetical protein